MVEKEALWELLVDFARATNTDDERSQLFRGFLVTGQQIVARVAHFVGANG